MLTVIACGMICKCKLKYLIYRIVVEITKDNILNIQQLYKLNILQLQSIN